MLTQFQFIMVCNNKIMSLPPEALLERLKTKSVSKNNKLNLSQVACLLTEGRIPVKKIEQSLFEILIDNSQNAEFKQKVLEGRWQDMCLQQFQIVIDKSKEGDGVGGEDSRVEEINPGDETVVSILNQLKARQQRKRDYRNNAVLAGEKESLLKEKLLAKLRVIYDYYRKQMLIPGQSFENNSKRSENIDLKVFMKYFKDFELLEMFELVDTHAVFKKIAKNTIWLDYHSFTRMHMVLSGYQQCRQAVDRINLLKSMHNVITSQKLRKMLNLSVAAIVNLVVHEHSGSYKVDIIRNLQQKAETRKAKMDSRYSCKQLPRPDQVQIRNKRSDSERKQSLDARKNQNNEVKVQMMVLNSALSAARKKVKTEAERDDSPQRRPPGEHSSKLSSLRLKTTDNPESIYSVLKLPKLRVRELKQQSIYESLELLKKLAAKDSTKVANDNQDEGIRKLLNLGQQEEYLQQYLNGERKKIARKNSSKNSHGQKNLQVFDNKIGLRLPTMRFT